MIVLTKINYRELPKRRHVSALQQNALVDCAFAEETQHQLPATPEGSGECGPSGDPDSSSDNSIRSEHPEVQCLILTSFSDDEALFQAIMAGASGYLLKQIRGTDLVGAVRRVAQGQSLLDPAVTSKVLERLRAGPKTDERLDSLTGQERKILDLIAEGLTNRQIAERVHLAEKTVKNYVSNLLAKLGMERRTQAAVYAARLREGAAHRDE